MMKRKCVPHFRRVICFALMLVFTAQLNAQTSLVKGKVINYFTNEPVPFASVFWKKAGHGVSADSSGQFILHKSNIKLDTIVVSYTGYEDSYHLFNPLKDTGDIILALPELKTFQAVEVKSKFNKGLRWWKNIVTHKPENNPYRYNTYSYELYNKLELDINNIKKSTFDKKLLHPFAFVLSNIDSNSEAKPFLPIFLTESLSNYYYSVSPQKTREEIKAVQTNGIKNETVMQFMGGVSQKINVYEEYISVFGKEFISPISSIGDKYYNYKGADTQTISNQKYFHLIFKPKQEGSNTFSGDCWIHSTTWAIQRINLNVSKTADINFVNQLSIIQEFTRLDSGKWVFVKDKFVADLSPLGKDKISFIGRKTSTYKNVKVNEQFINDVLAKNRTKEEIIVSDSAREHSKDFWNESRHEPLSLNENKVYHMIDTLKQMPVFIKYSNTLQFIFDGHKKLGAIEIGPWFKWASGNQLEKVRLRFDLGTTEQFSKRLRLYGYLAYGFQDARFKGKAGFNYKLNKTGLSTQAYYLNDLDNGRIKYNEDDDATTDNLFSQLIRRQNIRQKFLGVEEYKVGLTKEWPNKFSAQISFKNADYITYGPLPSQRFFSMKGGDAVINSEFGLKLRYAPGERDIETHRKVFHVKSLLPVIEARYGIAVPDIFKSEYSYQRLRLSISQSFRIPRWGHVDYMVYGGKYFGDSIPFMLLEVHPGNEIYYYNKQSFNLMNRFEYFSDQYAGLNLEYNFEKKLMNLIPFLRKAKARQFVNVKTVVGDLNMANRIFNRLEFAGYRLKRLRGSNYTEIGTGIDNLFKFFRIDLVWRFDPQFTVPAGSLVPNNPQHFGIFGSFHLQF